MLTVQALPPSLAPETWETPAATATAGEAIGRIATGFVATLEAAENASTGALTGEVGLREAVDAVMEAERSLRTAAAIRDKLVAGWLDLSRMSI